jgi:membrane-associated phospholipid phosphatase
MVAPDYGSAPFQRATPSMKSSLFSALTAFGLLVSAPVRAKTGWEQYSDIAAVGIPAAALILTIAEGDTEGAKQLGLSMGVTLATTYGLKEVITSTRPNGQPKSFPSGHAAWAFSGAAYLEDRYGWKVGLPAHAFAIGVAFARVESDNHRLQDVLASAVIAEVSAYIFTSRYDDQVQFLPFAKGADAGATLAINF